MSNGITVISKCLGANRFLMSAAVASSTAPSVKHTSTKSIGTAWKSTNPSSVPRSCPKKPNAKLQKLVSPHLESFNYFLNEGLSLSIANIPKMCIQLPNQHKMYLWIESAQIGFPSAPNSIRGEQKLFPSECRQRKISYTAPLVLTLARSFSGSDMIERIQKSVGDIPIMVRSSRCHLQALSPSALVLAKEEAFEMGGYFICNGNERCIRLLQMPRRHHIMCIRRSSYMNRGDLYTDLAVFMKCVRRDQSSVTITLHYLEDGSATARITIRKQEFMIPVGLLLRAMYSLTDREVFERILRGDRENTFLMTRLEVLLRQSKSFQTHTKEQAVQYLGEHFRHIMPYLDSTISSLHVGQKLLDDYIFVHIPKGEGGRAQKVELLLLMIRKLYAFAKSDICEDNPDSVMNQELLLPGHLYGMIIKEKLQDMLHNLRIQIEKETKKQNIVLDGAFLRKVWDRCPNIGTAMMYFLNTGNLKTSSGLDLMQVAGYTIVAEKLNFYRYFSHFRSVHRGQFFTEMKTTAVRKLLPDSWGFMCPVHTPDGSPCGLLNHLAVECQTVNAPPFTSDTVMQEELKLARFLTSYGLIPSSGYSDGALIAPFTCLPVLLNGKVLGYAYPDICIQLQSTLRSIKADPCPKSRERHGIVYDLQVCLILPALRGPFPGLFLSSDTARLSRPVRQLATQRIEYIGPMEQVFLDIACTEKDIRRNTTHIEIDPMNILSLVASLTPFSDYNQSPRNMYQCQMAKQTMGTPCHSLVFRTDNKLYRIQTPQVPIVQNKRLQEYQLDEYPIGTNAVVAVISYTGYDMEDAMILNKSSYERGFAHASVYKQISIDLSDDKSVSKKYFSNPDAVELDPDGLPHIGQLMTQDSPLASYVDPVTGDTLYKKYKDAEPSIVEQVNAIGDASAHCEFSRADIKLRYCRNPVIGDKFSSRHGQKGVLSMLWPQIDMPFTETGMSPDIIINPHAFPSRMTIGMLIESMAAKTGALSGTFMDATPFQFNEKKHAIQHFGEKLKEFGYNYMGSEPLYSGISGTIMQADIYIGLVYYQRLRHMVNDKSQVRSTGPMNSLTRQPVKGRKKGGGIRFGEMERDSLLAHGCSFLLQDRLMHCSDKHIAVVCGNCESLISSQTQKAHVETLGQNQVASALQVSQQNWYCRVCETEEYCEKVAMPYVFRYLINELAAMNMKLSLRLECH